MRENGRKNVNVRSGKIRKVRNINIGIIVILLVFIYLIVTVVAGLSKKHLSIYEVQAVSMAQNNTATALIIRNEECRYAESGGYTNFFVRNGSRVSVGDRIYSIDPERNVYDYLNNYNMDYALGNADVTSIKNYISDFNGDYSDDNFEAVYTLKESLEAEMLNISDSYLMDNIGSIVGDDVQVTDFNVISADRAGIISFFSDSLDGITAESVTAESFDKSNYTSKNLYDSEIKNAGSPIYKIIDDSKWTLVIKLDKEQYENIKDKSSLSFTIKKDELKLEADCSLYEQNGSYFCRVDLMDYMIRYIKDRFLEIELNLNSDVCLKIPFSSIVEKEFYSIPSQYYTDYESEDGTKYGFTFMKYDEVSKETTYQFVETEVYYEDPEENVVYVSTSDLEYGQYVYCMQDETLYQASVVKKLKGAFNVNNGYAIFRRIVLLSESNDYCIIKAGEERSLNEHDHIALHAELIDENLHIY